MEGEGYRRAGYRRLHLGVREQVALLHGVDPKDEIVLACATISSMCSEAAVFAQSQRWEDGGRTWKMITLVCFGRQRFALP